MSKMAYDATELQYDDTRGEVWRYLKKDRLAIAAMMMLGVLFAAAVLGRIATRWFVIFDPATVRLIDKLKPPLSSSSSQLSTSEAPWLGLYPLGTDELGRDVFARMLEGASVSLSIGIIAVSIAVVIGVALGAIAGYMGERKLWYVSIDALIMRFTDVMLCFPVFFLILTVVALLPPSIYNIMIVIGVTGWMGTARFVRAEFLSLKQRDFVLAARALGLPPWRVMLVHMLPNALPPVLVTATIAVATAILTESALSFLGFGVQPPHATWGNILADGKNYIFDAPWLFFAPGLAILAVVLAFNLVGEALREAFDPNLRR